MDFAKMTRMQAERLVARTGDEDTLRSIATQHKNSHVKEKAEYKIAKLENEYVRTEHERDETGKSL